MNSALLEEVVGFQFRPIIEVLRNNSTLEEASGTHTTSGGGNGKESGAIAGRGVHAFSFSDALFLGLVAWGVWHALKRSGVASVQHA